MTSTTAPLESPAEFEDVLAHLPVSDTTEYSRRQMIYGPDRLSKSIYLVVFGKVGISQLAADGSEVLLEIVRPDELFGESAFLDIPCRFEQATALEGTKVMTWTVPQMEDLLMKRPRLAVALLQVLVRQNAQLTRRIQSFSLDTIERRLARSLLHFSERLGTPEEDGAIRMMPFTHLLLSRYVGTSREIISYYMNRFRKQGFVSYSRQSILLYRDSLKTVLNNSSFPLADSIS